MAALTDPAALRVWLTGHAEVDLNHLGTCAGPVLKVRCGWRWA